MKITIIEEIRIKRAINWDGYIIETFGVTPILDDNNIIKIQPEMIQKKEIKTVYGQTLLIQEIKKLLRK